MPADAANQKSTQPLRLVVIEGSEPGRTISLDRSFALGSNPHLSEVVLRGEGLSGLHARFEFGTGSPKVYDENSTAGLFHNGQKVDQAFLAPGDMLKLGSFQLRVEVAPGPRHLFGALDHTPVGRLVGWFRSHRLVFVLLVIVMWGALFVSYGMYSYYTEKALAEMPMTFVDGLTWEIPTKAQFPESVASRFPDLARGGPFLPSGGKCWISTEAPFRKVGRAELANRGSYPLDLAVNPLATALDVRNLTGTGVVASTVEGRNYLAFPRIETFADVYRRAMTYDKRSKPLVKVPTSWNEHPPRLGNGAFLPEKRMVLGYYSLAYLYFSNDEYPGRRSGELLWPLTLQFAVECWDGLPRSASIDDFMLSSAAALPGSGRKVARVPKLIPHVPAGTVLQDDTETYTGGVGSGSKGNLAEFHFRIRQEKRGETLLVVSAKCYPWDSSRLSGVIDELMDRQELTDVVRSEDERARFVAEAEALEREADQLVAPVFADREPRWETMTADRLPAAFKAFHRYYAALVNLQRADRWLHDPAYDRVFSRAHALSSYFADPTAYMMRKFNVIEANKTSNPAMALREAEDLLKTALAGQEPEHYAIDEWFIYAAAVEEELRVRVAGSKKK